MSVVGEIVYNTEENIYEWEIINFPSLFERVSFSSPEFSFANTSWFFQIIPKSTHQADFLAMKIAALEKRFFTIKYKFGFIKPDGTKEQIDWGIFKGDKLWTDASYFNVAQVPVDFQHSGAVIFTCTFEHVDIPKPARSPPLDKSALKNFIKLDTLSDNLKGLFADKDSCDATLYVQGKEYKAHRNILIARSSVFSSMFRHDTSEKQTGIVNISDCDPESFGVFLEFLYCGKIIGLNPNSVLHLYEISEKYDNQELKAHCLEYMKENITVENFTSVIMFSVKYDKSQLFSAAQDFFCRNFQQILKTTDWDCLAKNNYLQSKRLLLGLSNRIEIND